MKKTYYTDETNAQIVIAFFKQYGIRKVIASPGATNITLVASLQSDPFFEIYSSVDERSAAYMACGLAEESGEAVVISCTGATASRNYMPGLTEAFYRKLPIVAVTSTQDSRRIGQLCPQVLDRTSIPNDIARLSVHLPTISDSDSVGIRDCEIKLSQAMVSLFKDGGGPVHLNLETIYSRDFSVETLREYNVIRRVDKDDIMPKIPQGKIVIRVGSHQRWSPATLAAIDKFCATHGAVVLCDHTSNYQGKYRILSSIIASQCNDYLIGKIDLMIHIGEVSGDYPSVTACLKDIWRVSEDGEIKDPFSKLRYVFKMKEAEFFNLYSSAEIVADNTLLETYLQYHQNILAQIPELPLSNPWIAQQTAHRIPENSYVYLGILNSLRSWNYFEMPKSVYATSNVGGFGIDGSLSTVLGSSLVNKERLYFCILGDLSFFYDLNALGNRHIGNNIRVILINNGRGTEFKNYNHLGHILGDVTDDYIAAAGHYGNKSSSLVKSFTEELGFEYLSANDKQSYLSAVEKIVNPKLTDNPIILEVFTDSIDESNALELISKITPESCKRVISKVVSSGVKKIIKKLITSN